MGILEGNEATRILKHEINKILITMPFNTSLIGYSMLVDAIVVSMGHSFSDLNLKKDIYTKLAGLYNVGSSTVEKDIKSAIGSILTSTLNMTELEYPSKHIELAVSDGKPKQLIVAMCQYMKINKGMVLTPLSN